MIIGIYILRGLSPTAVPELFQDLGGERSSVRPLFRSLVFAYFYPFSSSTHWAQVNRPYLRLFSSVAPVRLISIEYSQQGGRLSPLYSSNCCIAVLYSFVLIVLYCVYWFVLLDL